MGERKGRERKRGKGFWPLTVPAPTFPGIGRRWKQTFGSLFTNHSSHTSLFISVQNLGTVHTGLKEIFQRDNRLRAVSLNAVVRRTSSRERVRIYVCVGAPGFEKALLEPSLPKVDMLLLTLRTTYSYETSLLMGA